MDDLRRRANESHRYQQDYKESQFMLIAARESVAVLQQQLAQPFAAHSKFEVEEVTKSFKGLFC